MDWIVGEYDRIRARHIGIGSSSPLLLLRRLRFDQARRGEPSHPISSGGRSPRKLASKTSHHKRACRSRTGVCTFAYSFGRTSGKVLTYSPFGLIAWQLWKEHNARIFRGVALQLSMVLQLIQIEGENWIAAGAKNLGCLCLVSLSLAPCVVAMLKTLFFLIQ